ncbi:MAG: flavin reductase (DIM6/NTAB) family NADH-FMN oxidoreductase RutF [Gammaproteobacteria bacterium]|jgi:flavin reductase (DIM6/NTAB) family NADH-FMN oxidoreductase RutF
MHYDAVENKHGLKHDPFKALVAPRPIGWIGTVSADGVYNLAPYSFFNAVADRPHYVMFSSKDVKDSVRNIHETGEFTCSLSTWDTRAGMNTSAAPVPANVSEFEAAGLATAPSHFVKPPRVKDAPAALECRHWKTIDLPDADPAKGTGHYVIIGLVVGIHIDDKYIEHGIVNTGAMHPIARMGYMQYGVVGPDNIFELNRPKTNEAGEIEEPAAHEWDGQYR